MILFNFLSMNSFAILTFKFFKNNFFITITDQHGNVLKNLSFGTLKINKTILKNLGAARKIFTFVNFSLKQLKIKFIVIKIVGKSRFLKYFLTKLKKNIVLSMENRTAYPHNGCRGRKLRRL